MMASWIKVKSFGGANTVPGSSHMITATIDGYDYNYLVDCGLFQGAIGRKYPELNFNLRDYAYELNGVFITHAHIDHVGRVPALYRWGYSGPIYATSPVCELSRIMLEDSANIQLEDYLYNTEREMGKKLRGEAFKEVELLYDPQDAKEVMEQFVPVLRDEEIVINEHLTVVYYDAGHGLGSSSIKLIFNNGEETFTMFFSGDLGNPNTPILKEVELPYITGVDAVFCESTYAGRFHGSYTENWNDIRQKIAHTLLNGGKVLLAAFAVGRTQEMLYLLLKDMLENDDWVADVLKKHMIYVDSVLAVSATKIFSRSAEEFKPEVQQMMAEKGKNPFDFPNLHLIYEKEESILLCESQEPSIILSAAGMCDAGRIVYHLREILERDDSLLVLTGYQAEGSMGRRILDGEKFVTVSKKYCEVKCEIALLNTISGHADQNGLISWLTNIEPGYMLFLIHGEEGPQSEFKALLDTFGMFASVESLKMGIEYELSDLGFIEVEIPECTEENVPKPDKKFFRGRDLRALAILESELDQIQEEDRFKCLSCKLKREIKDIKYNAKTNFIKDDRVRRKNKK